MNCNCVRFSPNGYFLAIGSDDFAVSVHKLDRPANLKTTLNLANQEQGINDLFATSQQLEQWSVYNLFRSHDRDVYGVAWSADSKMLASCSIDNTVVIYDIPGKRKYAR